MAGKPTLDLAWNLEYRLTQVTSGGNPVESYQYDPTGRRIKTVNAGGTTWHVYGGAHVIADVDDQGELIRSYTFRLRQAYGGQGGPGIDNLLALTVHDGQTSATYYAVTDHLGTVHALVDADGDAVESYRYDAWGNILGIYDANGQLLPSSGIGNRYLFQGREYSFATGLYSFRARYYDPLTGRWLSNDPVGIGGGLNQYVAFGNNPLMFVDPWGEDFIYLIDPAAVSGHGHTAVITGPVDGQWRYDSYGKVKREYPPGIYYFDTEQSALDFARDQGYTMYLRYRTSPEDDARAQSVADEWHTGCERHYRRKRRYGVLGNNCQALVDAMAAASGLVTRGKYLPAGMSAHPNRVFSTNMNIQGGAHEF